MAFKNVADLDIAIQKYFDMCNPHVVQRIVDSGINEAGETIWAPRGVMTEQKPYTMTGLARSLGIDRRTLKNYSDRDEFFPSIEGARSRCEEFAETMLYSPFSNGAKFNLTNNYDDWTDKRAIDHTSKGKPMPLLGGTTPMVDDEEEVETPEDSSE